MVELPFDAAEARSSADDIFMQLVESALSVPAEEREDSLRAACGSDIDLFRKVSTYVQWEERMAGFLLEPVIRQLKAEPIFEDGDILERRFRIVREVAQGGMGVIYDAWDERLQRRIAIKCAKPGFGERLPPEVRNASQISHPNVCKIFEIHTTTIHGRTADFITMEFLDGETLADRIRRGRLLSYEALTIARQLAAGLAEAHRNHVVHGDLKGNNIILAKSDGGTQRAVITDFGLAHQPDPAHHFASGVVGGALAYMAPELLEGAKASPASDVFAFGVLFHELLTGRRPGARPDGPSPSVEREGVHRKWQPIIARCLRPDPSDRFRDGDAVLAALEPAYSRRWITAGLCLPIAVAAAGGAISLFKRNPGNSIPSIAVLPFTNNTSDASLDYLSDGLSESLIHALSQLPGVKVIARSSSWRYHDIQLDVRGTARALGVQALVIGRLYRVNGELKISAELVDGEHGTQSWGGVYSPREVNLASVQGQLATGIALQIRSRISPQERMRVERWASSNPEAYELLLRGRYQTRLYTTPNRLKAISFYEQALAVDPGFALAHAELAYTIRMASGGGIMDPAEALPKAEAEARRALAIAPDLAEAVGVIADIHKDRWEWSEAERGYRRALDLSPSLVESHVGYAIYLSQMGRTAEAIYQIEHAKQLDPLGLTTLLHVAAVYYNSDLYDRALEALNRAQELDTATPVPWSWRAIIYSAAGRFAEAFPAFETAMRMGDTTSSLQCFFVYALARAGRTTEAREILNRLRGSGDFVPPTGMAAAYLGFHEKDLALEMLEQAYAAHDSMLQYLTVEAHFDELRGDNRYRNIARKMGLPL